MKTFQLPEHPAALIFDMDGTLYTHDEYMRSQIDLPVKKLAALRGKSFNEMQKAIKQYQDDSLRGVHTQEPALRGSLGALKKGMYPEPNHLTRTTYPAACGGVVDWAVKNSGKGHECPRISLGNTFKAFGIGIEESIQWREMLYEPERYLKPDPRLRDTLASLAPAYKLAVVTNNPVSVARRTLACLGVDALIPVVVGLDTCKVSKPHEAPFRRAAELCGVPVKSCVSIGDRYEIDISLPLEMGMGGILVDGVEDVYGLLPSFISPGLSS